MTFRWLTLSIQFPVLDPALLGHGVFKSRIPILTIMINIGGYANDSQIFHDRLAAFLDGGRWMLSIHANLQLLTS